MQILRYNKSEPIDRTQGGHPAKSRSLLSCQVFPDVLSKLFCSRMAKWVKVSICLECNSSKLRGLKRKWIRCSAQATVLHLKKFIAKKLNLASFNELLWHPAGGGAQPGHPGGPEEGLYLLQTARGRPPWLYWGPNPVGACGHRQAAPQCLKKPGAQHFRHTRKCWGEEDRGHLEDFRVSSRHFHHTGACLRRNARKQLEPIRVPI
ncbi:PCGF3 protein, partial [Polypterus senegalus]